MKFIELKENEPLEVIEITYHMVIPRVPNPYTGKREVESDTVEDKRIQMRIFTDGEIEKQTEETSQNIEEYYIGKKKYQYDVDTLKIKNIYFKNHSYVITYIIANEIMTIGNVTGWFSVIKDVSIYLSNPKDKKALKCAKQVIREIANHNNSVDYSSLFGMLFSRGKGLQKFETEEISKNVYSLKKQNK